MKGWRGGDLGRLSMPPLIAAVEAAAERLDPPSVADALGGKGTDLCRSYYLARARGRITVRMAENVCDQIGRHPAELWGQSYYKAAIPERSRA